MVLQDLRLALNNYSLGTAKTATRLTNSYINRTTKNWLDMAKTPEEKKFVAAAKTAYIKMVQTCRKLDFTAVRTKNYNMPVGYSKVTTPGQEGKKQVIEKTPYINGEQVH